MKKIIEAILVYIRINSLAVYSSKRIIVDGKPFFMISEEDEDKGMTLVKFVGRYLPEGNNVILKQDVDFYIFSDYKTIGFLDTKVWDEYQLFRNEYTFFIEERTKEIKAKIDGFPEIN